MHSRLIVRILVGINALAYLALSIYWSVVPAISLSEDGLGFSEENWYLSVYFWMAFSIPTFLLTFALRKRHDKATLILGTSTLLYPVLCWCLQPLFSVLVKHMLR